GLLLGRQHQRVEQERRAGESDDAQQAQGDHPFAGAHGGPPFLFTPPRGRRDGGPAGGGWAARPRGGAGGGGGAGGRGAAARGGRAGGGGRRRLGRGAGGGRGRRRLQARRQPPHVRGRLPRRDVGLGAELLRELALLLVAVRADQFRIDAV